MPYVQTISDELACKIIDSGEPLYTVLQRRCPVCKGIGRIAQMPGAPGSLVCTSCDGRRYIREDILTTLCYVKEP